MGQSEEHKGQAGLKAAVLDQHLCTGCAACVDLCPYLKHYRDHTVVLHECDRAEGRCHAYCPRTPTDLQELQEALFEPADLTAELGAVKGLYLTRAGDPKIRAAAQHGGTVSALVSLALEQGIIEQAVLAGAGEGLLAEGCLERDAPEPCGRRAASSLPHP